MNQRASVNWTKLRNTVKGGKEIDSRFWVPAVRKDGGFNATIRFLPAPDFELPFVEERKHGFQSTSGKWFIEQCLRPNEKCPICDIGWDKHKQTKEQPNNAKLKNEAKKYIAKQTYYVNILVLKDAQTPENEGKVFLWKFGNAIYKKIVAAIEPPAGSGEDPIDVFDYENGTNFKVNLSTTKPGPDGKTFLKFDDCKFSDSIIPLSEEVIKVVDYQLYELMPFVQKFNAEKKSSSDLLKRHNDLNMVFEESSKFADSVDEDDEFTSPPVIPQKKTKVKADTSIDPFDSEITKAAETTPETDVEDDEEEDNFLSTLQSKNKVRK